MKAKRNGRKKGTTFTLKQPADLMTPEGVAWFHEASRYFTEQATRTKETARQSLIDAGIYTKSGRLSKNYR